jgi:hypothetical protein
MTVRTPARASDAQVFTALSAATSSDEPVSSACDDQRVGNSAGPGKSGPAACLAYWLSGNGEAAMRGGR